VIANFDVRNPGVQRTVIALLLAAVAVVLLWTVVQPRRPFEYMVAGTFATALGLALMYVAAVKRRLLPGFTFRLARSGETKPQPS
jgi:hypothetical protein